MNWGVKIFTVYGLFVAFMIFMVMQSMRHDVDLVSKDYYAKELVFQGQIEKVNRTKELLEQPSFRISGETLELKVPNATGGEVVFFRPSDPKLDFAVNLTEADAGNLQLPLSTFSKGMYKIKVDYRLGEETYYSEETIVIP